MVSSSAAVLYGYALWLIGRRDFHVPVSQLRGILARWFFASHTTGRYSSSPESRFEADLTALGDASDFVAHLDTLCNTLLTNDYWTITYPSDMATSAAKSPALSAYFAALNVLHSEVLFSTQQVSTMLDPSVISTKGVERHHLFPQAHLKRAGITETRRINQIANLAFVEWFTNIGISDDDPKQYWPTQRSRMLKDDSGTDAERLARRSRFELQLYHHGLATDWYQMEYEAFLIDRRARLAGVVREAWLKLKDL